MQKQIKEDCCKGCQNGQSGTNPTCRAKLMVEKLKAVQHTQQNVQQ